MTNRTPYLYHIPLPTTFFSRTRALQYGLLTRGGFGEENTLADAIPLFHYYFHCFSHFLFFFRVCKILCTIVSPFLTQPGLLVMGGCIIGWVSSVVQLPCVCVSTLSGSRLSVSGCFYRRTNNYGTKVWKAVGGTILYEGNHRELTAIPSKISVLEIIHHDVSKLRDFPPVLDLKCSRLLIYPEPLRTIYSNPFNNNYLCYSKVAALS